MLSNKTLITTFALLALTSTALTPVNLWAKAVHNATAAKPFAPQLPDQAKGVDFAQNHSDIKADPAVRFGKLPNGMSYVILKNATPPGTASLRLRIGGGSMMENEQQRGLAHFIEHMAFNGSKNVPEGDMVKILERHGLKFGPDTNAFTSFDETVYELDLPKTDVEELDTGLFLLRETAGNLLLDDGAIDRERGVILGEERLRDNPGTHDFMHWSAEAFDGQKYPVRVPIGLVPVIQTSKHDIFADFYNNYYRPENATLIVVGDVDPAAIEAKIKAKFSDWTSKVSGPVRVTDFGAYKTKGPLFDTYSETGLPDTISMSWSQPLDEHYQTSAKNVRDFMDSLRIGILNQRLERQAKLDNAAFASASASHDGVEHTAQMTQLNITPKPGQDKLALSQAYATLRQYAQFGADQAELDRVIADTESSFKAALQQTHTRENRSLAESFVETLENNEVFTSPAQDYAFFEKLKPTLTLAAINDGIKPLFSGDGPFLWHSGETLGDLDKNNLKEVYDTVNATKLAAAESHANKPWPYTSFGAPAAIVKREEVKDLGVTQLTYANGLKATIKSTQFKQDEIGISVRFAGGLKSLSPATHPPVFAASTQGVLEGGLGKLTASDIKDSLTGKIYGLSFSIGEDATYLSGGTTKTDFATQMQVLMAYTTDAAYRADAFARLKSLVPNYYTELDAAPDGIFALKGAAVLHSHDPRFGMMSQNDFLETSNDQIKALIDTQLKTAPVEITIVGDITEAQAEAEIAKTFAALSPRAPLPVPADSDTVKFPTQDLKQVFEHHGRADQDLSFVAWPGVDFFSDTKRARTLTMLAEVLTLRLTDVVREKDAISYSPNAGSYTSQAFTGYGYISAEAEVKPEMDQRFYDELAGIVADLKAKPISADELLRAQKPVLDKMDNEIKTNSYWQSVLPGSASDPRRLDSIRSRRDQYTHVTADDIQKMAQQYLDMDKALRIQVKPAATAANK